MMSQEKSRVSDMLPWGDRVVRRSYNQWLFDSTGSTVDVDEFAMVVAHALASPTSRRGVVFESP